MIKYEDLLNELNTETLEELRRLNKLIQELEQLKDSVYNTQAKIAKACGEIEYNSTFSEN